MKFYLNRLSHMSQKWLNAVGNVTTEEVKYIYKNLKQKNVEEVKLNDI